MSATKAIGRLSLRDLRRHPGRALLTIILVAIPVAAAVFVSTWMHTAVETPEEAATRQMGQADAVTFGDQAPSSTGLAASLAGEPGWRVVPLRSVRGLIQSPDGSTRRRVTIADVNASDPLFNQMRQLDQGRWPSEPGEVVVTSSLKRAYGLHAGDTLDLIRPQLTLTVVGIGQIETHGEVVVKGTLAPSATQSTILFVQISGAVTAAQRAKYQGVAFRDDVLRQTAWGRDNGDYVYLYLLSTLGLAAFGLIISAALSVGSRRQMREIGVMRAGGGSGTAAGLRVALYAFIVAVIGTVVGVGVGIGTAPLARGFVERRTGTIEGSLEFSVKDILIVTVAAVVIVLIASIGPARAAARVSVLAALAGRRPLPAVRAHLPMAGVVVFVSGCFATAAAVGADSQDRSMLVILSVALTLAGVVMCTPYLIGKLERVGSRARGSQRLALRSLARQRSRSGPMAAAIMAAGCLALGGATYALAVDHDQRVQAAANPVYRGSITLSMDRRDVSTGKARDVSCEDTLALLRREVAPLMHSPQTTCFPFHTAVGTGSASTFTVVNPSVLTPFDLQAIARHLADGKIVAMIGSGAVIASGSDFSWLTTYRSRLMTIEPPEFVQTVGVGSPVWISPQTAQTLGLHIGVAQTVGFVTQSTPFSGHQSASIDRLVSGDLGAALSTATDDVWVNVSSIGSARSDDYQRIVYAIILPIGIVLSLLTVAVGLFLLNAESRDERTALVALGAGPSERRRQNAWQAGGLAFVAMLLAVPPGLALPYVVMRAADNELTYGVPWVVLAVLVIGVPLMAAVGAFVLTRSRVHAVPRRI